MPKVRNNSKAQGLCAPKKTIVRNNKYFDCFVAMPSFKSGCVVAHGQKASTVRRKAVNKGHKTPVVIYIPPKGAVCLY